MTTYPIVLQSQPQHADVLHRFEVAEGSTEGSGFERISTWLKLPWADDATKRCTACGAVLEIPDGSLKAHLNKYQTERGGKDVIVQIIYRHKGPRPSNFSPDIQVVTDTTKIKGLKEFVQMRDASSQDSSSDVQ